MHPAGPAMTVAPLALLFTAIDRVPALPLITDAVAIRGNAGGRVPGRDGRPAGRPVSMRQPILSTPGGCPA
jgi:hypothetical protein